MAFPITSSSAQAAQSSFLAIAVEGDPAPMDLGGTYSKIESSSIDDFGEIAFSADISGAMATSALLLSSGGVSRVILRAGDGTPAGGSFKAFHELDIANGDFILFRAELQGIGPHEGIFLWTPGGIQTVQLAGDPTNNRWPGLTYKSFSQLTINSFGDSKPSYAFLATITEFQAEAVAWNDGTFESAQTVLLSGIGDSTIGFLNEIVDHFSIARLGTAGLWMVADCHTLNNAQEFRRPFQMGSSLGSIELDNSITEGLRAAAGKLRQLDTPVSVTTGTVYFRGDFGKKGVESTAILSAEGVAPAVLLQTGDRASGLKHKRIEVIGLPVARSGSFVVPPIPRNSAAVVAAVQLNDGQNALWVYAQTLTEAGFTTNVSFALVDGVTGDPANPVLTSFNPVKLTNNGAVLISGTIGSGGSAHNSLFLLSGLF